MVRNMFVGKLGIAVLLVFLVISPLQENGLIVTSEDLSEVNVAVLAIDFTELANVTREAMVNMFVWMNATVDIVNATDVRNGNLYNYDIVGLPPGNLPLYTVTLQTDGLEAIRQYVNDGGSFVGIAGGALFACDEFIYGGAPSDYSLDLFDGIARGPIGGIDEQTLTTVNINHTNGQIDFSGLTDTVSTLYWGGTYFQSDTVEDIISILTYPSTNQSAMIAYQYGNGYVCLSGLHIEFEESSDRDGTDMFDELNDPDSEWPLMMRVSQWMVESSTWITTTTTTETDTTTTTITSGTVPIIDTNLIIIGSSLIAVIVVLFVVIKLRR